jgi:hypothetical protein
MLLLAPVAPKPHALGPILFFKLQGWNASAHSRGWKTDHMLVVWQMLCLEYSLAVCCAAAKGRRKELLDLVNLSSCQSRPTCSHMHQHLMRDTIAWQNWYGKGR